MRKMQKVIALLLALWMVLSLCGCSTVVDKFNETRMVALVQGNLDELYLGKFDEEYLESVSSTLEEAEVYHEEGLDARAELFAYYFNIEYVSDELHAEIKELCREIYGSANYTVGSASQLDDATVVVKVEVQPVNIIELMMADFEAYMADFYAKYPDDVVAAMDDDAYVAYDNEWADLVIALCREKMTSMGYSDTKSVAVQVVLTDDLWCISEDSMLDIEDAIVTYP